jgi:hypothetical protein
MMLLIGDRTVAGRKKMMQRSIHDKMLILVRSNPGLRSCPERYSITS